MPRSLGQPVGDLAEAARDEGEAVAEPAQDAHQRARARGQDQLVVHLVEGGRRDARRGARRGSRSDSSKSSSPRIARSVTAADLGAVPAVGGQQLDHLALDQRGVDVHHDQPHRAAQQARGLDRDVDALRGGLEREQRAQPVGVGAGDVQVDGGDRVARHPLDPVDVGAAVGDPAGDGGHRRGLQRRADHGDVRAALAPALVVAGAAVDLDAHAELGRGRLDGVAQLLPVARGGDQDAEDQPAPEHDLLDVEHLDAGVGQGPEHRRGDAGPVLPGDVRSSVSGIWSVMAALEAIRPRGRLSVVGPYRVATWHDSQTRHHTFDYVELAAPDIAAAKQFYADAFGWTLHRLRPRLLRHPPARRRGRDGRPQPGPPGRPGLPLVILYSDDLDATYAAVQAAGGTIDEEPFEFPGGRRFHFTDPAGNALAVWQET